MTSKALPKRGHNKDFALTEAQHRKLLASTNSELTRRILIMVRGNLSSSQIAVEVGISRVAVWRRIKKALLRAVEDEVLDLDLDKLPFPEALRTYRKAPGIIVHAEAIAQRMHILNGGLTDHRDPLTACPHLDCSTMRDFIALLRQEGLS